MNMQVIPEELEVGYNIPAMVGMDEADIQTPCLILDLDALERNIIKIPRHSWLWFWLAMAAGILVKGPVLPVLALLSVAALCLWHRQVRWLVME